MELVLGRVYKIKSRKAMLELDNAEGIKWGYNSYMLDYCGKKVTLTKFNNIDNDSRSINTIRFTHEGKLPPNSWTDQWLEEETKVVSLEFFKESLWT